LIGTHSRYSRYSGTNFLLVLSEERGAVRPVVTWAGAGSPQLAGTLEEVIDSAQAVGVA
jgi:hypothetical protein